MASNPYFSIIIPTYNRAEKISRTIESCLNQTFNNYEIIIIDDGSTDNTEEKINSFKNEKIRYFKKKNEERAVARNFGISVARGEYLTFLDSDDTIYPELLNYVFNKLESLSFPEFYNQAYEVRNEKMKTTQVTNYTDDDLSILIYGNSLSCIGNFLKKSVTENYKFNEDKRIIRSEDWELWIRIASKYGYKSDNKVLCTVTDHDGRSVRNLNTELLIENKYVAIDYAFKDPIVAEKYNKHKTKIYAYCDTYIALHLALKGHKNLGLRYLISGVKKYPAFVFKKRFYAIIKHLIF